MATTTAQAVTGGWVFPHVQTTVNGNQSPTTSLTIASTTGFPSAGTAWVRATQFTYTAKTGTTFTGCTGLPASVVTGDVVLIGGLPQYRGEHLLNGMCVSQVGLTPAVLESAIDGFKTHNATSNTRAQRWSGETI